MDRLPNLGLLCANHVGTNRLNTLASHLAGGGDFLTHTIAQTHLNVSEFLGLVSRYDIVANLLALEMRKRPVSNKPLSLVPYLIYTAP